MSLHCGKEWTEVLQLSYMISRVTCESHAYQRYGWTLQTWVQVKQRKSGMRMMYLTASWVRCLEYAIVVQRGGRECHEIVTKQLRNAGTVKLNVWRKNLKYNRRARSQNEIWKQQRNMHTSKCGRSREVLLGRRKFYTPSTTRTAQKVNMCCMNHARIVMDCTSVEGVRD